MIQVLQSTTSSAQKYLTAVTPRRLVVLYRVPKKSYLAGFTQDRVACRYRLTGNTKYHIMIYVFLQDALDEASHHLPITASPLIRYRDEVLLYFMDAKILYRGA